MKSASAYGHGDVPDKLIIGLKKLLNAAFALLVGAILVGIFLITVWPPLPPPAPDAPPVPGNTPGVFYVGNHAFKVPRDYSVLPVSDFNSPGSEEVIFDFSYPWFTAWDDDPRVKAAFGTSKADDEDVTVYITEHQPDEFSPEEQLLAIKAGTTTDWLRPGPYQLIEVHQRDDWTWISNREYIGILDGLEIHFLCGNPSILLKDGTRDDNCVGIYTFGDLDIEEGFSVPNLKHWQAIMKKVDDFLKINKVQ